MSQPSSNKGKQKTSRRKNSRGSSGGAQVIRRRELTGYKFTPSAGIPDSTPKPWYPLVISFTSTPQTISAPYLLRYFYEQIDTDACTFKPWSTQVGGLKLEVRFQKVEVWNLTGRAISLTVWEPPAQDYSTTNAGVAYNQLGGWTDAGNSETFPRVGYVYSFSHSNIGHTFTYDVNSFNIITTTAGSDKDTILHRFHILWRPPGTVKYTSVIPHSPAIQDLVTGISKVSTNVEKVGAFQKDQAQKDTEASERHNKQILDICRAIKNKIPTHAEEIDECVRSIVQEYEVVNHATDV